MFNTLVPQGHPGDLRRLELPMEYRWKIPIIHLGSNGLLETSTRNGPLAVDSNQAICLIDSLSHGGPRTVYVLQIRHLVEHASSVRAEVRIPWCEWGRYAMTMRSPAGRSFKPVIIHGSHLLAMFSVENDKWLDTFDFGPRGNGALRFSSRNNEQIYSVKRRLPIPQKHRDLVMETPESWGDSVAFDIVRLPLSSASGDSTD